MLEDDRLLSIIITIDVTGLRVLRAARTVNAAATPLVRSVLVLTRAGAAGASDSIKELQYRQVPGASAWHCFDGRSLLLSLP